MLNAPASPAEMGALITSLRELHEPAPIGWWPPSPAWWALALLLIVIAVWLMRRRYHRRAPIRLGRQTVISAHCGWQQHRRNAQYLSEVNTSLRRIALTVKPRTEVARLTGASWIAMLNAMSTHRLADQSTQALSDLAYRPDPDASVEQLHADVLQWINQLKVPQPHA